MKNTFVFLFVSLIIFIRCSGTNTHLIYRNQVSYNMLNLKLADEGGEIVLKTGDNILAEDLIIEIDSTSWTEEQKAYSKEVIPGGSRIKVPAGPSLKKSISTLDIDYLTFNNSGKGALSGAGTGFWVGAAAGGVIGISTIGGEYMNGEEIGVEILIVTMPLGGLIGAILGLPIGAGIGGTDKYILSDVTGDSIISEPTREEIVEKPIVNYIDVEVSAIDTDLKYVFVEWQGKKIQLLRSDVVRRGQSGDKLFIRISEKLYESKFK